VNVLFGVASVQQLLFLLFSLAIFALSVWALVDCLTRPARAFPVAGKRTRTFWLAITALAVVVAFLGLPLGGVPGFFQFLALAAAVAAVVYLVDVRPAVAPYSRRRRGGRGQGGYGGSSRGGW
jgi:hypothetical protein